MQIIGVAGNDTIESSLAFVQDNGVGNIEHVYDNTDVWSRFGITSQPSWAFINDDGDVEVRFGSLGAAGLNQVIADLEAR